MAEDLRKSPQIAKIKLDETVKYNDLKSLGLPLWPNGKEPACQCRRCMLNPDAQSLVQEDPTCCGATMPMCHNY